MSVGRPRIEIDWPEFDRLCSVQCTLAELAAHFGTSEDTIERAVKRERGMSFADYFALKRKAGFVSLRRKQYELAMAGNATMLIFLGKQYLGQADRHQVTTPAIEFTVERIGSNMRFDDGLEVLSDLPDGPALPNALPDNCRTR